MTDARWPLLLAPPPAASWSGSRRGRRRRSRSAAGGTGGTARVPRVLRPAPRTIAPPAAGPRPARRLLAPRAPRRPPLARGEVPPRGTEAHRHRTASPARTPPCPYYRVTDARVHALVGDGRARQGRAHPDLPLPGLRHHLQRPPRHAALPPQDAGAPGRRGADRAGGRPRCRRRRAGLRAPAAPRSPPGWPRAGAHGAALHARWFRGLHLPHLQLDELRTRLRGRARVLWLWVALDPLSKLVPVPAPRCRGPRPPPTRWSTPCAGSLAPGCLPVFTSDGLRLYFYALTAHFGQWVAVPGGAATWRVAAGLLYGQVTKTLPAPAPRARHAACCAAGPARRSGGRSRPSG